MTPDTPWLTPPPAPAPAAATPTVATPAPATPASQAPPGYGEQTFAPQEQYRLGPPFEQPKQGTLKRRIGAIGAALAALFAKFKALLLLLPKIKIFSTAATALVSTAAYSVVFGWPFAVGFVVLLFVHEMGHVIALRREGIKASAPMFIPFMGAVISAKSLGDNALAEARVGLAGPILGSIGAAVCIFIYHATGNDMWRALAYTGFFLNLFNLLPVVPLDGGRAMAAMAPAMWFAGFAGMVVIAFVFPNPIILIILVFGALETRRRWMQRRGGGAEQEAYYRVKPLDRALVAAVYLSLIALLVVGMHGTSVHATF